LLGVAHRNHLIDYSTLPHADRLLPPQTDRIPHSQASRPALALFPIAPHPQTLNHVDSMQLCLVLFSIKKFCNDTKDPLVPSVWGKVDDRDNRYIDRKKPCVIM
jgi:hypothetical protein